MTWLEIRPQDVWLFRDGKPFAAGEDHSAHSIFPPTPLTVQGALRQKISVSLGVSLREYKIAKTDNARKAVDYIGSHGELWDVGKFRMQGPFISLRTETRIVPLFPVPADLLKYEKADDCPPLLDHVVVKNPDFLITNPERSYMSDLDDDFLFPQVYECYENLPGYWMAVDTFEQYLANTPPNNTLFNEDSEYQDAFTAYQYGKRIYHNKLIYQNDERFGVSTNALTSFREEGQLYQVQFIRPQHGIGLLVSVSDDIPTNLLAGAVNIGGEQRQANIELVENIVMPTRSISRHFKVIFLTPAYFDDGWQPKNGDWTTVFGHSVALKSAALYRPLKIGGWNSEKGRARHMHNYVAPGSVYYFETEKPFLPPDTLTQNPSGINAQALGFGQYAIGQWKSFSSEQE